MRTRRSFDAAAKKIRALKRQGPAILGPGLRKLGEEVLTDVTASRPGKGVPKDTGMLASTGRVEGPNAKVEVTLSFGGAAAPYALVQHENIAFAHDKGEARYLVRGLERWRPDGSAAIAALKANAEAGIRAASRR